MRKKVTSLLVSGDVGLAPRELGEVEFWRKVQDAFVQPESAEMRAERRLWDRTESDGFEKTRR